MTSIAKWTPRAPFRPKDNLMSSAFTNTSPSFVPSYGDEPEDMWLIMSNGYAKQYHHEKKAFKENLLTVKIENEAFLMRRYVIKGYQKKMQQLKQLKKEPSRVIIGKKVPFAVRLRPSDGVKTKSKPVNPPSDRLQTTNSSKGRPKSVELSENDRTFLYGADTLTISQCDGRKSIRPEELAKLAKEVQHVHVEQVGRKFKIHKVICEKNHHHGCDCEGFAAFATPCKLCPDAV